MPSKVRAISSVRPARASSDVPNSAPARPARKVTDGKKANSNRAGQVIQEGLAKVRVPDGIFFNPAMRLCRDLSSLWVGTLPPVQNALDAFCATGIRGLRYKQENENVGALTLLDASPSAAQAADENILLNKLDEKFVSSVCAPIEVFLASHYGFDLAEIDPFGTPAPFLPSVLRSSSSLKTFHLSITATDTAVLCGAHAPACLNQYNCKPLDNEFCHENAVRILLGHLARAASQFDFSLHPQVCFSDKHYVKLFVELRKGAPGAVLSSKQAMKFVAHCPKCLWHSLGDFPPALCPLCGGRCDWAGPLWGGEWASKESAEKMIGLLPSRPYLLQKEAGSFLGTIASEAGGPALYYDLHELASRHKRRIPSMEDLLSALQSAGLFASRTHFKAHSIRTNASLDEILQFMSKT